MTITGVPEPDPGRKVFLQISHPLACTRWWTDTCPSMITGHGSEPEWSFPTPQQLLLTTVSGCWPLSSGGIVIPVKRLADEVGPI